MGLLKPGLFVLGCVLGFVVGLQIGWVAYPAGRPAETADRSEKPSESLSPRERMAQEDSREMRQIQVLSELLTNNLKQSSLTPHSIYGKFPTSGEGTALTSTGAKTGHDLHSLTIKVILPLIEQDELDKLFDLQLRQSPFHDDAGQPMSR